MNEWIDMGNDFCESERYEDGLRCYDEAVARDPRNDTAWYGRGWSLYHLARYSEAISSCDKAISINPINSLPYYCKGLALAGLGKYQEALESYEKAIKINQNDVYFWDGKAIALVNLRRYEDALESYVKIAEVGPVSDKDRKVVAKDLKIVIIQKIVSSCFTDHNLQGIRKWAQEGQKVSAELGYLGREASFLVDIGSSYEEESKYLEALDYYTKAYELCPKEDPFYEDIKVELANILTLLGRTDEALGYLDDIDPIKIEVMDDPKKKRSYYRYLLSMARRYEEQYDLRKAEQIIEQRLLPPLLSELPERRDVMRSDEARVALTLADALRLYAHVSWLKWKEVRQTTKEDIRFLDEAVERIDKALPFCLSPIWEAGALYESAKYRIYRGNEIAKSLKKDFDKSELVRDLNYSIDCLNRSISKATEVGEDVIAADSYVLLARCMNIAGKPEDAERLARKGVELWDKIVGSIKNSDLRISSMNFDSLQKSLGILCDILLANGNIPDALGYAEAGKAREMFHPEISYSFSGCKKRGELIDVLNSLDAKLRSIADKKGKLARLLEHDLADPSLKQEMLHLTNESNAIFHQKRSIEDQIWKECPDPGIALPIDPKELVDRFFQTIDSSLANNGNRSKWALLEMRYFLEDELLVFFLLDHTTHVSLTTKGLSNLGWYHLAPTTINKFRRSLEERQYEQSEKSLIELQHLVMEKLLPQEIIDRLVELNPDQLMIVPDGIFHSIPFELITNKREDPLYECWGIKYRLARGFSMNHFSSSMLLKASTSGEGLILGNPTDMTIPVSELEPSSTDLDQLWYAGLPGTERESWQISDSMKSKGKNPVLLLRDKGSENNLISHAKAGSYSFVHIACHARFDSEKPDQSYILLNNGDKAKKFYANEIPSKIHFSGHPVITLSACETGLSKSETGDEAFGLVRGFTLAGASNLILSGWPVFDVSAPDFMNELYTNLFEGQHISEAMKQARLEVLRLAEDGQYGKDYQRNNVRVLHWGAYQLWGNPFRSIVNEKI